jgi:hypothetical protein
MSRVREAKRQMRRDVQKQNAVPALYIPVPDADPVECNVRVWLSTQAPMLGDLLGGRLYAAGRAEPEDQLRFDLSEFSAPLRSNAVVSVEPGEAYRLAFLYPVDLGYQTARVTRLSDAETVDMPVPASC